MLLLGFRIVVQGQLENRLKKSRDSRVINHHPTGWGLSPKVKETSNFARCSSRNFKVSSPYQHNLGKRRFCVIRKCLILGRIKVRNFIFADSCLLIGRIVSSAGWRLESSPHIRDTLYILYCNATSTTLKANGLAMFHFWDFTFSTF